MPCQRVHARTGLSECQLSLPPHSTYYYIRTPHGEGEVEISKSAAVAAGALSLPSPSPGDRPTATVHPHWCHNASTVAYLGSLAYCATLGSTFGHDH